VEAAGTGVTDDDEMERRDGGGTIFPSGSVGVSAAEEEMAAEECARGDNDATRRRGSLVLRSGIWQGSPWMK
jgi:hypothetical protein